MSVRDLTPIRLFDEIRHYWACIWELKREEEHESEFDVVNKYANIIEQNISSSKGAMVARTLRQNLKSYHTPKHIVSGWITTFMPQRRLGSLLLLGVSEYWRPLRAYVCNSP
jgi:hypothetical protein